MKKLVLAMSLAAASTVALANGFYLGGSLGQSHTKFNSEDFSANSPLISESKKTDATAWKLFGGYDFNQYVAVEAGYADLGAAKYKYTGLAFLTGLSAQMKTEHSAWFGAAKGTLPINDQFNVFGKLGVTFNKQKDKFSNSMGNSSSESKSHTDALLGAGAEYLATKNIGIRVEYDYFGPSGDKERGTRTKVDLWSVGVAYKF